MRINTPAKPDPDADDIFPVAAFHGGDVWGLSRRLGRPMGELLDLSSSLNPMGPPPGLSRVLEECLPLLCHHPDRQNLDLRRALARCLGLHPRNLLPGNGITSLFRLVSRALDVKSIIIMAPAFSEFGRTMALTGRRFHYHILKPANYFGPTHADLETLWAAEPSCVILTNPLMPSGALADPGVLDALLNHAMRRRTWVVIDESFMDFAPEAARSWAPQKIVQYPRLLVMRSLTNFWCLAGLRLSYLMAHRDTLARLAPMGDPWSVNTVAQQVGLFCLQQDDYTAATREKLPLWRQAQSQALAELGMNVQPSQTSYQAVILPSGAPEACQVGQACADQGVLVRDCSSFPGCHAHILRVGIASPEKLPRLMEALRGAVQPA